MRVSTSQIFDAGTLGIQRNQSELFRIQNQLSTGRRALTPADDPIATSQALVVSQSQSVNAQYLENQKAADNQLSLIESKLGSVGEELKSIYEKAIQAGNGSLSDSQRGMIAAELKNRYNSLVGMANSQDGNGLYIFSGYKSDVRPFQDTGAPAGGNSLTSNPVMSYQGDAGLRLLQVSPSEQMAVNESGADVFMQVRDGQGNLTGRSMFDSVKNLINILDPGSGVPFSQAAYDESLGDVSASIDHVSRTQASVGARLAALESLSTSTQDVGLQYEEQLSQLEDLDYAKAISDLSRRQLQLEAAQKSFAQTSQLSLFSII